MSDYPQCGFPKGNKPWNKGKPYSQIKDEKHPMWKGNEVKYGGLHVWICRKLGKLKKCSSCGRSKSPKNKRKWFHWHNISGKYKRDLNDWIRLCILCHRKYHKKHDSKSI